MSEQPITSISAANARIAALRAERDHHKLLADNAVKEAQRRDQKWMDGIIESCGQTINFDPLDPSVFKTFVPTLRQFVEDLRAERDVLRERLAAAVEALTGLVGLYWANKGNRGRRAPHPKEFIICHTYGGKIPKQWWDADAAIAAAEGRGEVTP